MKCRLPMRILTAEKIDYADNFADNDWATIAKVCAAGIAPDSWKADGTSYKDMTIGGNTYRVVIVGKEHDEFEDGKKAPFTFQLYNSYKTTYAMNSSNTNVGGWEQTALRNTHLPIILAAMPSEVQAAIKPVKKLTSAGNLSTNIVTTLDKLFVPSEVEVFGHNNNSVAGEGSRYEYYKSGGSKIKTVNGTASSWQERSPSATSTTTFCCVASNGGASTGNASMARGVSPMFCFGNKVGGSSGGTTTKEYAVTITEVSSGLLSQGVFSLSANGTNLSVGTVAMAEGTKIAITGQGGQSIALNGTVVATSSPTEPYYYTVSSNTTINVGRIDMSITTE